MPTIKIKQPTSIAMLALALALSAGLAGCGKQDAQQLVAEAKQYQQKGDNNAAMIQLKNALQKNPENGEARYLLASLYAEAGDWVSAEKEVLRAASLGWQSENNLPILAKALLMQGQFQKVLDETEADPRAASDANIATLRGNAFMGLGKPVEANQAFRDALANQPDYADALLGLARLALMQRDVDSAMALIDQAAAKNPTNTDAWLFKGDLLRSQGKTDEALAAYDKVLKIKPGDAAAHLAKAYIEIGSGKFAEAKANIDAAKKSSPNSLQVVYSQALLDFSQKKNTEALESLQQVLRVAPEHMPSILLAGAVQLALGSTQQAEQHLKKFLDNQPNHLYARKLLVSTLLRNGQVERAVAALAPALRNEVKDAQLYMLAGETYMQAKDFNKATEYFEKADAIAPGTAMVHTALGLSKLGQGQNERAIAELEKAAALDTQSPRAGILLVMTHLRMKEFDKALTAAQGLEKEQPDNPLVQNLKGGIYLGKKDLTSARASFDKALALQPDYFPAVQNLARLDMQDNKPEVAKKRFEALLIKDPKNAQAMTALAGIALAQNNQDEAQTWLERAVAEQPDAIQPARLLAGHYIRNGDKQKALQLASKLQITHPDKAEYLELLGETQFANDDKAAALASFDKVALLLPESASVQFRIGGINMTMQNNEAAAIAYRKALKLDPKLYMAQIALAGMEIQKGNHAGAMTIARQLQQQEPALPLGFVLEGDVLMAQKQPAQAIKPYEQAFALLNNTPLLVKLHAALVQADKRKDADAKAAQWLKTNPGDMRLRMYLADNFLKSRQNKAAIEQLQAVVRAEPKNVPALNNLAWALGEEKDPRALGYAEQAYQLAADNPAVLDTLGWMLVEKGATARGLPMLQKATELAPNAPDIRYHLAQALAKSGNKVQARKELELLLVNPHNFARIDEAKALLKQL